MGHRRYKNPPIHEALVEFRFEPSQDWDLTMPGRLHTKLSAAYSGKPRQQNVVQASLTNEHGQAPNVSFVESLSRVQLTTQDGTRLVAIGPDVLSVHMLRPYQRDEDQRGWNEFRQRINEALKAYHEVAEPLGIRRIGVRYINKVSVPEPNPEVGRYLRAAPPRLEGLPERFDSFVGRVEYTYGDHVRLSVSHATVDAQGSGAAFLVDIDMIWESDALLDLSEALDQVDHLHTCECDVFEALITDEARGLFDVV